MTYLDQDHGGDFFRSEGLGFTLEFNLDDGLGFLFNNLERPVLHIRLDFRVSETATDQTKGPQDKENMMSLNVPAFLALTVTYRLASKTVPEVFKAAWFLAASPIKRSESVKAT
jgi:hypothetical protein